MVVAIIDERGKVVAYNTDDVPKINNDGYILFDCSQCISCTNDGARKVCSRGFRLFPEFCLFHKTVEEAADEYYESLRG